jgi:acyl dehydratase
MSLSDFEGRSYGPVPWRVAPDAVGDFISLTGDDDARWKEFAPPGFAAAALFSVAPDLLDALYDRSVVHGEQTFEWARVMPVGAELRVEGVVTRVRERGGVHFMTFEVETADDVGAVVTGKSLFLLSGESLAAGAPAFVREEPPHSHRGEPGPGEVSASRADLIRYASATRDWNPVHWDHEAAVGAGFPGVVVHGLLQAGWALRVAASGTNGHLPFSSARFRFRNPLQPARPVSPVVSDGDGSIEVVLSDPETEYLSATMTRSHE